MQNFISHIPDIVAILTSAVGTAALVCAAFGKPDNKYLGYAYKLINFLGANFGAAKNASDVKPTDAPKS